MKNNKLRKLPEIVTAADNLSHLDLSRNHLSAIPYLPNRSKTFNLLLPYNRIICDCREAWLKDLGKCINERVTKTWGSFPTCPIIKDSYICPPGSRGNFRKFCGDLGKSDLGECGRFS